MLSLPLAQSAWFGAWTRPSSSVQIVLRSTTAHYCLEKKGEKTFPIMSRTDTTMSFDTSGGVC